MTTPVPTPLTASALTSDRTHLGVRSFSRVTSKTRERAAERGEAMGDGSFPIRDAQDLRRAIKAYGRAKDKGAVKRHIVKRARALEKVDLLPSAWRETAAREFHPQAPEPDVNEVLKKKAATYNALTASAPVSIGKLRCVYNRGLAEGPQNGLSADARAMARVNSFLYVLRAERALTASIHPDVDLLPADHPLVASTLSNLHDPNATAS